MKKFFFIIFSIGILWNSMLYGNILSNKGMKEFIITENDSIKLLIKEADSLKLLGNHILAEKKYVHALSIAKRKGDQKDIVSAGLLLYNVQYEFLENYTDAEEVLDFLLAYCQQKKDDKCIITSLIKCGQLNQKRIKFIEAFKCFNLALELAEKIDDSILHWEVLIDRGVLLSDIGDIELARKDYEKALELISDKGNEGKRSQTYINISSTHSDNDSSIYYSKLALKYCVRNKDHRICNLAHNNIAWSNLLKGDAQKAYEYIKTNMDLDAIENMEDDSLYPALMHTIGAIYLELGSYQKAIEYFKISEKYFIERRDVTNTIVVKEDLSKAYEKIGNLRLGITVLREIKPLISTMDSLKITKEVAKRESKKILNNKEEKILDLEQKNAEIGKRIHINKWIGYLLITIIGVLISGFLYRGHKNKVRFHQLNEELSVNRLKSLRSMMNPHFLFNSFSTLQNYILKKDNLRANEYMTELSALIRDVLSSSDSLFINFKEELQILKSYIRIEQERFVGSFEVDYSIDKELIDMNPKIPSMVIQPYIENAIIHGFSHSSKRGMLILSFEKKEDNIICKVIDNGIGRDEAERLQKEGNDTMHLSIATRNTDERLRILSKIGNKEASILINDLFERSGESKGTEVIITLPLMKK